LIAGVAYERVALRNIGIVRRVACELSRDGALHPVAILLAGEFAGQRRRAAFDADPTAVGLALMPLPAASSTEQRTQTAATTTPATAAIATSAEELAQVKALGACITR
jgi:hypothetical protein